MRRNFLITFFVSILNFWFWKIAKLDLILAALVLTLSILLSISLVNKFSRKYVLGIFFLTVLVSVISLTKGSDRGLLKNTQLDISTFEKRHEYYAKELGMLYKNRVGIFFLKSYKPFAVRFETNLFSSLDPNLYFFAGHPRERGDGSDFEKYPYIYLPIFVIGLIEIIKKPRMLMIVYSITSVLISSFLYRGYNLGPILFFPLINTLLFLGIMGIVKYNIIRK